MSWRSKSERSDPLRVRFSLESMNKKTGPIPVSTSSPGTCPPSCSWYGNGCYAESHYIGNRWRKVPSVGLSWDAFLREVKALPRGQIWRHNEAGDLPGVGEGLDEAKLDQLVEANSGLRGFTYTHKDPIRYREAIERANRNGLALNVSCDTEARVDELRELGHAAPLVVVVAHNERRRTFATPGGARIVVCPAQTTEAVTCESCGLCARVGRKSVIGFKAHGSSKRLVSARSAGVQRRLPLVV